MRSLNFSLLFAEVVKLVDAVDSKSAGPWSMGVRFPPSARKNYQTLLVSYPQLLSEISNLN
jgi:hypothetical protein